MTIRAFFRAAKVETAQPPYDTIHLKVFYPAQKLEKLEINQDIAPADTNKAPFPVVIFFSGLKCGMEMYQWLAIKLAERGLVVVTFNWIEEYIPGKITCTPGFDLEAWKPENYGTKATSYTLPTLLIELENLNKEEPLAGWLDLQNIILGGHSAGGRMAIENANPRFFPQIKAAFSYASHSAAPVMLGHEPNTMLPLPDAKPLLLMGGTCDGVMAKISSNYGLTEDATISLRRTFNEAIYGGRNDSYLLLIKGANHFSISEPFDTTQIWASDYPSTQPEDKIRSLMVESIGCFIEGYVCNQEEALQKLCDLLNSNNYLIQSIERK
ncbi:MAG: dienelactone hydrolase [Moorea sp. SIO2B7]|nr:dienelactone hydrolase [Moorena sp. SIO2B7]